MVFLVMFKSTVSLINSTEIDISEYLICLKNNEVEIYFYDRFPQQDFLDFEIKVLKNRSWAHRGRGDVGSGAELSQNKCDTAWCE